jgi:hypothetical protein
LIISPALQECEIKSAATRPPVVPVTCERVGPAYSNKYFDEVDEKHAVDELGDNHETGNDTRVKITLQQQAARKQKYEMAGMAAYTAHAFIA